MRFNTNVQNICKLQSFTIKLDTTTMRKLILLLILVTFFSCEKNDTIDFLNMRINALEERIEFLEAQNEILNKQQ